MRSTALFYCNYGIQKLATERELSDFLIQVERRAFKQAVFAVHDDHAALDIVQDAMMRLAEKYGTRPVDELPMLFQRILQNAIRDYFRRHKVRALWTTLLSSFSFNKEGDEQDPLETLEVESDSNYFENPANQLDRAQTLAVIEDAVGRLPARQREAFVLRYWEDMDVAETAAAMGCSEGSVKTHCSRAVHSLAAALKDKGVRL
jgi:RNA polymerase sigma-70 factor (ECF subfamily)